MLVKTYAFEPSQHFSPVDSVFCLASDFKLNSKHLEKCVFPQMPHIAAIVLPDT